MKLIIYFKEKTGKTESSEHLEKNEML